MPVTISACSAWRLCPPRRTVELLDHCRAVAREVPLCGFYLQPSVGGRPLSYEFWRGFCGIEGVAAIKVAPFNRYQTLDVLRGVADSGRAGEIALYTGNDDNIIADLLTDFRFCGGRRTFSRRPSGAVGRVDAPRRGTARRDSLLPRVERREAPPQFWPIRRPHRCQTRRCSTSATFRRMHRRAARNTAPPGTAGGSLVPGPGRGPFAGADGRDRPCDRRLPRTSPTTTS